MDQMVRILSFQDETHMKWMQKLSFF